jgi:hypothetical protein
LLLTSLVLLLLHQLLLLLLLLLLHLILSLLLRCCWFCPPSFGWRSPSSAVFALCHVWKLTGLLGSRNRGGNCCCDCCSCCW